MSPAPERPAPPNQPDPQGRGPRQPTPEELARRQQHEAQHKARMEVHVAQQNAARMHGELRRHGGGIPVTVVQHDGVKQLHQGGRIVPATVVEARIVRMQRGVAELEKEQVRLASWKSALEADLAAAVAAVADSKAP